MQCHRNYIKYHCTPNDLRPLVLLFLGVVGAFCLDARSNQLLAQQKSWERYAKIYMERAFESSHSTLHKLALSNGVLTIWPNCVSTVSSKCDRAKIKSLVNGSLPVADSIRYKITTFSPSLYIKFADQNEISLDRRQFHQLYAKHFSDIADEECVLFYKEKQGSIREAAILISLDATDLKQRVCLTVQFNRALGMGLPTGIDFAKFWNDGIDPVRNMSEQEYENMKDFHDFLAVLHMCSKLSAGMTSSEAANALTNEVCWSELEIRRK